MKRSHRVSIGAALLCAATLASGCGGAVSSGALTSDIANLTSGLAGSKYAVPPSGASLSAFPSAPAQNPTLAEMANTALWIAEGHRSGPGRDGLSTIPNCPASPVPVTVATGKGSATLGISCPSAGVYKVTLTSSSTIDETCGSTPYSISGISVTASVDFSRVSKSASSPTGFTGTSSIALAFSANVTGGSFDGSALACDMALSYDASQPISSGKAAPQCGSNFSCTYGGSAVSCSDLSSKYPSATTSCAAS